ncbi:MAG: putative F420-dependent enzyme [Ilumatobacteraceae bacterium]|nr:putative F420-dependent enzyme [Ilumatobacteraceae bacterium]
MDITGALEFASTTRNGVLTTIKRDGRPQLSNISHQVGDDGLIRISITADRAKYWNLTRDARASLYVTRADFWAYVVIDGDASLAPVAAAPDDATVEALVALYRSMAGEHQDWDDYRRAMVADHRTVVTITPTHAYGMVG